MSNYTQKSAFFHRFVRRVNKNIYFCTSKAIIHIIKYLRMKHFLLTGLFSAAVLGLSAAAPQSDLQTVNSL